MGFLTPWALFFAALSIPIIVLYMLKLRRRDVLVSSTLLWQRLLRDREANAPWQRLRRNLLLFLQLLVLFLVTLSLARPFLSTDVPIQGSAVVILDASASMQAQDVEPSRFEAAKRAVEEILDGLGQGDALKVVIAGPRPVVLEGGSGDRNALRREIRALEPTQGGVDWEATFALAAASVSQGEEMQTVLVTDGALPETLPSLPGEVRLVTVGGGGDNVAITTLATRQGELGPQALVRVSNYSDAPVEPLVELAANGALFDARRVRVPAHASADVTVTDLPYDTRVLRARIDDGDALAVDNVAWAVHVPPVSGRVLLHSPGNLFLERALGGLPNVELTRVGPEGPLPAGNYDLTVHDRVVSGTLSVGNHWLIAPPAAPPESELRVGEPFTQTAIVEVDEDDPILRYVDWSEVAIRQALEVVPPPDARVLVEAEGGPLLFVVERPTRRLAVLTFALEDSDLPLRVAFPLLTANLVHWLLPEGRSDLPAAVEPGAAVSVRPDPLAAEIRVTDPSGEFHSLTVGDQALVFGSTGQLGVYWVEQFDGDGERVRMEAFAVALSGGEESDIAPLDQIQIGQRAVEMGVEEMEEGRRELWPWLAGAALVGLAIEWWAYQRGALFGIEG